MRTIVIDEGRKKELVVQEIRKRYILGEHEEGGSGHFATSGLYAIYVGEETTKESTTTFPFSVEICELSEFGERRFWYYGTITIREDGTVKSAIEMHHESGMNLFLVFVPEKEAKKIEEKLKDIRKELKLDKARGGVPL